MVPLFLGRPIVLATEVRWPAFAIDNGWCAAASCGRPIARTFAEDFAVRLTRSLCVLVTAIMRSRRPGSVAILAIVTACGSAGCRQTTPSLASVMGLSGGNAAAPAGGLNPTLSGPSSPFSPSSTTTASGVLAPSFTPDTTVTPPTSTTLGVPTAIGGATGPATPYFPAAPFPSTAIPTGAPATSSLGPTPSPVQTVASAEAFGSVPMGAARLAQRSRSINFGSPATNGPTNRFSPDFQARPTGSPVPNARSFVSSGPIGSGVRPATFVETSSQSGGIPSGGVPSGGLNHAGGSVPASAMSPRFSGSPSSDGRDGHYQTLPAISPVRTGNSLREPVTGSPAGSSLSWRRPGTGPN